LQLFFFIVSLQTSASRAAYDQSPRSSGQRNALLAFRHAAARNERQCGQQHHALGKFFSHNISPSAVDETTAARCQLLGTTKTRKHIRGISTEIKKKMS
jgi:hypothetical protein